LFEMIEDTIVLEFMTRKFLGETTR